MSGIGVVQMAIACTPVPKPGKAPGPVIGIDLLRIFAALLVMVFHFAFKTMAEADGLIASAMPGGAWIPFGWWATWFGWVGVQVFFLVSGLVIAFSARASGVAPWRFLRSRVLRLVPAVLIAASFAVAVEITVFGMAPGTAVARGLRTIAFWPMPPWIMGQFWTIGIEISFYSLIFALLAVGNFRDSSRLATVLIVGSLTYWIASLAAGGGDPFGRITALLLLQHGAYFGMGLLLSESATTGWRSWHLPVMAVGLLAAALQIRIAATWEAGAVGLDWAWPVPFAVFVACLVFAAAALRWNPVILSRIGKRKAKQIRMLGMMTYPLYLIHNHIGKPVILLGIAAGLPIAVAVGMGIVAAVAVAWVVARFLEPKIYHFVARIYDTLASGLSRLTAAIRPM